MVEGMEEIAGVKVREGRVYVMQGNEGCRGRGVHQPLCFISAAALFNLRQQKIGRAIYLCTELQRQDEQTCKP